MGSRQDEILEAIRTHLTQRGVEPQSVTPQAELAGDLDLDSLDTVELTLGLESAFDIEIPFSRSETWMNSSRG